MIDGANSIEKSNIFDIRIEEKLEDAKSSYMAPGDASEYLIWYRKFHKNGKNYNVVALHCKSED